MSKAFTRESDDSGDNEITSVRPPLPPGTTNYITPEGAERLQQRLKALLEKKELLTNSSNGTEADLRKLETGIRNLQQTLNSVVVAQTHSNPDKVAFGTTIRIRHQNGEEETYRIVGVEEAAPENGSISWLSPLARALLSRKVGDKVPFRSPAGVEELTVLSVE
jgi:transcription elongation factor GreB